MQTLFSPLKETFLRKKASSFLVILKPTLQVQIPRVKRLKARVSRLKAPAGRLNARVRRLKAVVRRSKTRVEAIRPQVK